MCFAFPDNSIDLQSFKLLQESDIRNLIPKLGPRLKLIQRWREYLINVKLILQTSALTNSVLLDFTIFRLRNFYFQRLSLPAGIVHRICQPHQQALSNSVRPYHPMISAVIVLLHLHVNAKSHLQHLH